MSSGFLWKLRKSCLNNKFGRKSNFKSNWLCFVGCHFLSFKYITGKKLRILLGKIATWDTCKLNSWETTMGKLYTSFILDMTRLESYLLYDLTSTSLFFRLYNCVIEFKELFLLIHILHFLLTQFNLLTVKTSFKG